MDEMISDQLETLLSEQLSGRRFGRRLLLLAGFFGEEGMPEPVAQQVAKLSRLVVLQELFESLLEPVNQATKQAARLLPRDAPPSKLESPLDLGPLMQQIEDTRLRIIECGDINYAEIMAWIFAKAKAGKIWRRGRSGR